MMALGRTLHIATDIRNRSGGSDVLPYKWFPSGVPEKRSPESMRGCTYSRIIFFASYSDPDLLSFLLDVKRLK